LAYWKENINNAYKYVWLAASSKIKGASDKKKFDTAAKLKKCIGKIRKTYEEELGSKDLTIRQRATALWIIDHLALRVGNEKGDDQADTVGCCSLRVEHLQLKSPKTITFDFLGKDSMRYQNTVEVDKRVFENMKQFCDGKTPDSDVFEKLTTTALNLHLKHQMPGLTAKVFRTFNASITLEKELEKAEISSDDTIHEKLLAFNRANREVAILCNHQRTVSGKFQDQMIKMEEKISEIVSKKEKLQKRLKLIKEGKPLPDDESEEEEESSPKKSKTKSEEGEEEKEEKKSKGKKSKESSESDDSSSEEKKRKEKKRNYLLIQKKLKQPLKN